MSWNIDLYKIAEFSTRNVYNKAAKTAELIPLRIFAKDANCGAISDSDGYGELCFDHKIILNAGISIDRGIIAIGPLPLTPLQFNEVFDVDKFEVLWFAKEGTI